MNALQLLAPPAAFFARPGAPAAPEPAAAAQSKGQSNGRAQPVLLVAGTGREHRLGRWLALGGEGVVNGAIVVALQPRPRTLV